MATVGSAHQDEQVRGHELIKDRFWGRLVTEVGKAAAAAAYNEYERDDDIRRGLDVVETTARAVNPNWRKRDDQQAALAWHHQSRPALAGKKRVEPISHIDVEEAAAEYLALPYRADGLDRLLTDMLMAAEMFAFADEDAASVEAETANHPLVALKQPQGAGHGSCHRRRARLAGSGLDRHAVDRRPHRLGATFSLIVFPFVYPGVRAQRQKFQATVMGMIDAYIALRLPRLGPAHQEAGGSSE